MFAKVKEEAMIIGVYLGWSIQAEVKCKDTFCCMLSKTFVMLKDHSGISLKHRTVVMQLSSLQ